MLVTCMIAHARVDQFLPQLSMEQFNTLRSQYRDIEHVHEGVLCVVFYLIRFFTSHKQFFSYVGMGLPGLNQY